MTNVALNKPTFASSQYAQAPGAPLGNQSGANISITRLAVDNSITQATASCFVSYSNASIQRPGTNNPYWGVDLGAPTAIAQLRVYLCQSACPSGQVANTGLQFWASNATLPLPWVSGGVRWPNPYANAIYSPTILPAGATPIVARYIWAYKPGVNATIQLCELMAMRANSWTWQQLSGRQNLAIGKTAVQSSVSPGFTYGDPNNAIDGITSTVSRTPNPVSNVWL